MFGIGKKQKLAELEKIINEQSHILMLRSGPRPEAVVMKEVHGICEGIFRQISDSVKIIDSTYKPDIFYSRIDFVKDRLTYLCKIEKIDASIFKERPSVILKKVDKAFMKNDLDFWKRYFERAFSDTKAKKTKDGQANYMTKVLDTADQYLYRATDKSKTFIKKRRSEALKSFSL